MAKLKKRLRRQVNDEAMQRFNPERSTLKGELRAARRGVRQEVKSTESVAHGTRTAIEAARPTVRKGFGMADAAAKRAYAEVGAPKVGAPGVVGEIAAATARDAAGTQARLAERLTDAEVELSTRAIDAENGRLAAVSAARGRAAGDIGKLRDRLREVRREEGSFKQGRMAELMGEAAGARRERREKARDRRNARLTAGVDAEGQVIPGGKADDGGSGSGSGGTKLPAGIKPATPEQFGKASGELEKARPVAKVLGVAVREGKMTKEAAVTALVSGKKEEVVVPPENQKAYDQARKSRKEGGAGLTQKEAERRYGKTRRAVPAISDPVVARAAVEQASQGHVSEKTRRQLQERGLSLRKLGLKSRQSATRRGRGRGNSAAPRPGNAPSGSRSRGGSTARPG